jgi:hypothetical protein
MKKILFVLLMFNLSFSYGQDDRFAFVFDFTFGFHNFTYNDYANISGTYISSNTNNVTAYSDTKYQLVEYKKSAIGYMPMLGAHIPLFRKEKLSFGLNTMAGIGLLRDIGSSRIKPKYDGYEDSVYFRNTWLMAQLSAYLQYGFEFGFFSAQFGRKLTSSYYTYSPYFIAIGFQRENFQLNLFTHLNAVKFYRQYSNGELELNRRYFETGLSISYYLKRKKE